MRYVYYPVFTLAFLVLGATAWLLTGTTRSPSVEDAVLLEPSRLRRQAIAFYEKRLVEDPHSALDLAQLAALSMEEGRALGDERAFQRAEWLARRSLAERTRKNGRSMALLVNALLAQHRFAEAVTEARDLARWEPEEPAYRALLAETLMEVGDYDAAIRQLGMIREHRADLGIAPRFARWAELTGQAGEARRILRAAQAEAMMRADLTVEQRAWFSLRLADVELRHGNLRSAGEAIDTGLALSPRDWRLLLARARLEAARGSWTEAARYADLAITEVASPEAVALAATAKRALGMTDDAGALEAVLEAFVAQPGALHRGWAFALLDRGRCLDAIIAAAAADTLVRQDVHTLDLLAWALHRAGRSGDALPIVRRAMRMATAEPSLRYHAGMIEATAGDRAAALEHFRLASTRENALSVVQRDDVRRYLRMKTLAERN